MIPSEYQNFIEQTIAVLKNDKRIWGIAAGGSYIAGDMDEFSDIDLVLAIDSQYISQVMEERVSIAGKLGDLLSAFTGEHVGEPRLLICLYASPLLHVDLKFVSTDEVSKRVEDPVILFERNNVLTNAFASEPAVFPYPDLQWIEDRFWVWIHYGAGKIGRGEIFEVIEFISFLRQTVIAPLLLIKRGKLPRGVRKLEVDAADDMPVMLQTVVAHNAPDCLAAIRIIVELYVGLRADYADDRLIIRERSEQAAKDYLDDIAAIL